MAVPTRTEAVLLLLAQSPTPRLRRHVTAVAEVASFLAHRAYGRGAGLDRRLAETAALLHDVDKALPPTDPHLALGHGHAGARWLADRGHAELSRAVAAHPVMRLADEAAEQWLAESPIEERIVAYADKRATDKLRTLEERFARWRGRHPGYGDALDTAFARARRLEAAVCAAAGVEPQEVGRLRWVDETVDRAIARGLLGPDASLPPMAHRAARAGPADDESHDESSAEYEGPAA